MMRSLKKSLPLLLVVITLGLAAFLHAGPVLEQAQQAATPATQTPPPANNPQAVEPTLAADGTPIFKKDANEVVLPISVINSRGEPILGVKKEQIQVFEDGKWQPRVTDFRSEQVSMAVGILIDRYCGYIRMHEAINDALRGIAQSSRGDETFVLDQMGGLCQDFTSDNSAVQQAVVQATNNGCPYAVVGGLPQAILLAGEHLAKHPGFQKKILIVVTEGIGLGAWGQQNIAQLINQLQTLEGPIVYVIGIKGSLSDREALYRIAEATGGEAFFPGSDEDAAAVVKRIEHDIRTMYIVHYVPTRAPDGQWRKLEVRVIVPPHKNPHNWHVRAKVGYRAIPKDVEQQ